MTASKLTYSGNTIAALGGGLHVGSLSEKDKPTPRDYSDQKQLQKLYDLGKALQKWEAWFSSNTVTALTAGCVTADSLQRLLEYVSAQIAGYAPEVTTPQESIRSRKDSEVKLDKTVFMAAQLGSYVEDNFNLCFVPSWPLPDGDLPENHPYDMEWAEADTAVAPMMSLAMREPLRSARTLSTEDHLGSFPVRLVRLAAANVENLIAHINSDGRGGFSRKRVDALMCSLPVGSPSRQLHVEFMATLDLLDALAGLAEQKDKSQFVKWTPSVERLQAMYEKWSDQCFAPTITGKGSRSTRQAKKKSLRRLVANVGQYGTLMSGVPRELQISVAIKSLGVIGQQLETLVKKIYGGVRPPSPRNVQSLLQTFSCAVVSDHHQETWARCLGSHAEACGRLVQIIGLKGDAFETPWEPKQYYEPLAAAGLLRAKMARKQFTEMRLRMQEAGIATQGPWKFIAGTQPEPNTKRGVADKWLVNPLAHILAPVGDGLA